MSGPDDAGLRPLARRDNEPVFDHSWQAQVLALADTLTEQGLFSPGDWSATLGEELRRAKAAGAPDTPERIEAWRRAYENTPHGQPVELSAGLKR